MNKRTLNVFSLIINLTLFIVVVYSVAHNFRTDIIREEVEWFSFTGFENFRYFTTLSNIFCALASLTALFFNVKNVITDEFRFPVFVTVLKLAAVTAIAVTFFTVTLVLSPMVADGGKSYFLLFKGNSFFLHFLVPALAIVNFCVFEKANRINFGYTLVAVTPVVVYSVIYLTCVLGFAVWPDFYNFTLGGNYWALPFMVLGMYLMAFGLAVLLRLLHNLSVRKPFNENG